MCGIVGYIGSEQAAPILLDGLSKLEYRGYDSAGIAVFNGSEIDMVKSTGKLKVLEELTKAAGIQPGKYMFHGHILTITRVYSITEKYANEHNLLYYFRIRT